MKKLESFKSREPPKRRVPKLDKIKVEVFDLYQSGYRAEQIQEFAKLQKIEVSLSTVKRYLRKLKASNFSFSTNPSAKPTKPQKKWRARAEPIFTKNHTTITGVKHESNIHNRQF